MINDTSLSCCKVVGYDWGQMVVVFMAQLVLVSLDWMHLVFFYLPKMGGSRKLVASYGLRNYPPGFSYHVLLLRDPQRSCCSQQASFYTVSNWLQASICCWCYPNSMDETQRSHADQFCSETFPDIGVKAVKKKRSLPWDIIIFAKSDIYPELFLLVDMKKEPWGNPLL